MTGNAGEWCRDWFIMRGYRSIPSRPGDGLKETVWPGPGRSVRGGNFAESKQLLDPRHRQYGNLSNASTTGLRPVMRVDVQR
jgi:formylglycine-generating enzyme required for sulfatase activity